MFIKALNYTFDWFIHKKINIYKKYLYVKKTKR